MVATGIGASVTQGRGAMRMDEEGSGANRSEAAEGATVRRKRGETDGKAGYPPAEGSESYLEGYVAGRRELLEAKRWAR
jgi:hypothetical protein